MDHARLSGAKRREGGRSRARPAGPRQSFFLQHHRINCKMAREKTNEVLRMAVNRKRKQCADKNDSILVERSLNVNGHAMKKSLEEPMQRNPCFGGATFLLSVDLASDINNYLRSLENKNELSEDFLDSKHSLVDGRMRKTLVNWLVQLQLRFSLIDETLSLAVWILDRSLIHLNTSVHKDNLQLVGATSMFIAAKFEEIQFPSADDFVYIAESSFTKRDIFRMEYKILRAISFKCAMSHSIQFLRCYRCHMGLNKTVYNLAKFISDVALVEYSLAHYKSSITAAAAIFLAAHILHVHIQWNRYSDEIGMDTASIALIASRFVHPLLDLSDPNGKFLGLQLKYQKSPIIPFSHAQKTRLIKLESNPTCYA
ncbi:G2/mitotic-specific cyclin-B [Ditylenchus destructor]|uniref:G2/mitotic-specific cyclin-B n=1 Tax=Ditylenchus destructor TaxID=166010 RepID=A0AAD4RB62_9BILA|nr:G2/mitotic-specific cyclin-B [Ditylenchus destructor]